jgi:hypothetical protein
VDDALDRSTEGSVAAGVVSVRVRVDDARDRLVGDGLDPGQDGWAEAGQFRIDDRDAGVGDEDRRVAAAERAYEETDPSEAA